MELIELSIATLNLKVIKVPNFEDSYDIQYLQKGYGITRTIKNISKQILRLYPFKTVLTDISFGGKMEDDYFY